MDPGPMTCASFPSRSCGSWSHRYADTGRPVERHKNPRHFGAKSTDFFDGQKAKTGTCGTGMVGGTCCKWLGKCINMCVYTISYMIKIIKYRAKKMVHHWIHHRFLLPCSTALQNTHTSSFAHLVANHPMGGNPSWIYIWIWVKNCHWAPSQWIFESPWNSHPHFCGFPPKNIPKPPQATVSACCWYVRKNKWAKVVPKYAPSRPQRAKNLELSWEMKYVIKYYEIRHLSAYHNCFQIFFWPETSVCDKGSRTAPNDSVLPRPRCTNLEQESQESQEAHCFPWQPLGIPSIPVWKTSGNRSPGSADNRPPRVTHKKGAAGLFNCDGHDSFDSASLCTIL